MYISKTNILKQNKTEKYNSDDIFRNVNNDQYTALEMHENNTNIELLKYKDSFFSKFKSFIFKILHLRLILILSVLLILIHRKVYMKRVQ